MAQAISKSNLKANLLEIFHDLETDSEELIFTKHGSPILKIISIKQKAIVEELFGQL